MECQENTRKKAKWAKFVKCWIIRFEQTDQQSKWMHVAVIADLHLTFLRLPQFRGVFLFHATGRW